MGTEQRQAGSGTFSIGAAGGALGVIAGLVQLMAGSHAGFLTGSREDTLALGLVTILISAFAIYSSHRASQETSLDRDIRIGWVLGVVIPASIGFMTAGLLWIVPGVFLLAASSLCMREIVREIGREGLRKITRIPVWKRVLLLVGFMSIMFPAVFGGFIGGSELVSLDQGDANFEVRSLDLVVREEPEGATSSSGVTGVLLLHMVMIFGGIIALVTGNLGARTLTISSSLLVLVSLLFFFYLLPNILFIGGAKFSQFDAEHFSALSGGWFMSVFGSLLLLVSQFVERSSASEKNGQT